jgi:hypothetical protein
VSTTVLETRSGRTRDLLTVHVMKLLRMREIQLLLAIGLVVAVTF